MKTDFTGMTKSACPKACSKDRCAISFRPVCVHPCGSGLQQALQSDPDTVERYMDACKLLGRNPEKVAS
jgi:hypothetical protein